MSLQFLAIGANRVPNASDYNSNKDLVAYGAGRTIALWTPGGKMHSTSKGHENQVTAVKFAEGDKVISGSEDGTIKLWNLINQKLVLLHTYPVGKSVTSLSISGSTVISGSMDGTTRYWKLSENSLQELDKFNVGPRFYPMCCAVYELPGIKLVAVGGSSNNVHIFTLTNDKLKLRCSLEGHENWTRSLSFGSIADHGVYLASGSQDRYIRIWKVHTDEQTIASAEHDEQDILDADEEELRNKIYPVYENISITFEALLMGHDDWIVSVQWHPHDLCLISASADSSVMCWKPDESSGVWVCSARLGDVSIKGSSTATGSSGGFWSLIVGRQGETIGAASRTGSWRLWNHDRTTDEWKSHTSISGHFKESTDCSWQNDGEYLLTTSLDQTTRLWATTKGGEQDYHEMARPQIHGYDMVAVKSVSSRLFISAGDEKTVRVFEEPKAVASLLARVSGAKAQQTDENLPGSATVPALGLSNKESAADEEADVNDEDFEDRVINAGNNLNPNHLTTSELLDGLNDAPKEDHLQRHTLFPELQKLYGHGYEISCIDVTHDRSILATCCKANNETHAIIRLYDIETCHQIEPPCEKSHALTITRLRFSPDDRYLLSVSRDRKWTLWIREGQRYSKFKENTKAHSRIVWDCAWIDETRFVTVARDKTVRLWDVKNSDEPVTQQQFSSAVTAVDSKNIQGKPMLAMGLENGDIYLCRVDGDVMAQPSQVDSAATPDLRITRISWNPVEWQFAVTSEDASVRIFSV